MKSQTGCQSQFDKNAKQNEAADDTWLADLPNDLGAFSLSSDRIPVLNPGKMGCVDEEKHNTAKSHHKHGELRI